MPCCGNSACSVWWEHQCAVQELQKGLICPSSSTSDHVSKAEGQTHLQEGLPELGECYVTAISANPEQLMPFPNTAICQFTASGVGTWTLLCLALPAWKEELRTGGIR